MAGRSLELGHKYKKRQLEQQAPSPLHAVTQHQEITPQMREYIEHCLGNKPIHEIPCQVGRYKEWLVMCVALWSSGFARSIDELMQYCSASTAYDRQHKRDLKTMEGIVKKYPQNGELGKLMEWCEDVVRFKDWVEPKPEKPKPQITRRRNEASSRNEKKAVEQTALRGAGVSLAKWETDPDIVMPDLAWAFSLTLLWAREKTGKSTFVRWQVSRLLRSASKRHVIYISEEPEADVLHDIIHFAGGEPAKWQADKKLHPDWFKRLHIWRAADITQDMVTSVLKKHQDCVVVVDTFAALNRYWWQAPENSADDITKAMQTFSDLVKSVSRAAVVIVHHANKARGEHADFRGAGAIGAIVDMKIELKVDKDSGYTQVWFDGRGRLAVSGEMAIYQYDRDGWDYKLMQGEARNEALATISSGGSSNGSAREGKRRDRAEALCGIVEDQTDPMTKNQLHEQLQADGIIGANRQTFNSVLDYAVEKLGRVEIVPDGFGSKVRAKLYGLGVCQ